MPHRYSSLHPKLQAFLCFLDVATSLREWQRPQGSVISLAALWPASDAVAALTIFCRGALPAAPNASEGKGVDKACQREGWEGQAHVRHTRRLLPGIVHVIQLRPHASACQLGAARPPSALYLCLH